MSIQNKSMLVSDVMMALDKIPVIDEKVILKEALEKMSDYRLGIACIVSKDDKLLGVLTDGDIRRKLLKVQKPFSALFVDDALAHSNQSPLTIEPDTSLEEAVKLMGDKQVWDFPVMSKEGKLLGLLHLHPAIQALMEIT